MLPRGCKHAACYGEGVTRRGLVFAVAAALLVAHAVVAYPSFFIDDAFISLRYAERFLHGQGLTWTDGERVEGYSNLLWVLGCALLGAKVISARILGLGAAIATIGAVVRAYEGWLAPLVLACAMPLAAWAMGGLEAPLVAALLAWGVTLLLPREELTWRQAARPGVVLAMLALTRPDGALLAGSLLAGFVLAGGPF